MTKLMGILNITNDSFSDGGLYNNPSKAIVHAKEMLADGADIIDIGAQSTAYGAETISAVKEWELLQPIVTVLDTNILSIDTFNVSTALAAIGAGVRMINDVKGGQSAEMLELIAANPSVKYISMFSLCIPARKDVRVRNFDEIMSWMHNNIKTLKSAGLKDEQIILDPGLSFVTGPDLSFELIRRADEFKEFGYPILIGPSRKSFISTVNDAPPDQRDLETVLISMQLAQSGVDILRIHNVAWHAKALRLRNKINPY